MDVIGILAGLAADAISASIVVSPVAIVVAVVLILALSTGLAARLVEAWEDRAINPPQAGSIRQRYGDRGNRRTGRRPRRSRSTLADASSLQDRAAIGLVRPSSVRPPG